MKPTIFPSEFIGQLRRAAVFSRLVAFSSLLDALGRIHLRFSQTVKE